ncbi:MAG: hypothetical protein OHK0052_04080 [Anaerolineales bacterium]
MRTKTIAVSTLGLILLLLFGSAKPSASKLQAVSPQPLHNDPAVLDICLDQEPENLYFYQDNVPRSAKASILQAIYDGPLDNLNDAYQPVILESLPTLENGGAVLQPAIVNAGDRIVDLNNLPVNLAEGMIVRPSGCFDIGCEIVYTGGAVSIDQIAVTFTLLPEIKWADGITVTASDSVYSFNVSADSATPVDKSTFERTASYVANSATQVTWTGLPGYIPPQYYKNFWAPLPEHLWGAYTPAELLTLPISSQTPIGYGAYVIEEWVRGSHISMIANPHYFRAQEGLPKFKRLVFHFSENLAADFAKGTCDIAPVIGSLTFEDLRRFQEYGWVNLVVTQNDIWEHLDFGIQPASYDDGWQPEIDRPDFFSDVNVRKAFAHCIDREKLVSAAIPEYGQVSHAYLPANHPLYPPDLIEYAFDPALGIALLESAGWLDTDANPLTPRIYTGTNPRIPYGTPFIVKYWATNSSTRQLVAQHIASDLFNYCGIQLNTRFWTPDELFASNANAPIFGRNFELAQFAFVWNNAPPCGVYLTEQIPGENRPLGWEGRNNPGYSNPVYDAACRAAFTAIYQADVRTHHAAAIHQLNQDLPVLPLYMRVRTGITTPYIHGFTLDTTATPLYQIEEIGYITQTVTLDPNGGTLTSLVDNTNYIFPAAAFTDTVTITHRPIFFLQAPQLGKRVALPHVFETFATHPTSGQFVQPQQPYQISITYLADEVGSAIEETIRLYKWDGTQWQIEPTMLLNTETNTLSATPNHFGLWAVFGETNHIYFPVIIVSNSGNSQ